MSKSDGTDDSGALSGLAAFNYCLAFIDLLGQRDAVKDQNLLPEITTEEERKAFSAVVRKAVGSIYRLQRDAEYILTNARSGATEEALFGRSLSEAESATWEEMRRSKLSRQRWSDGLAIFACLGDGDIKCQMNSIFELFCLCGVLCFLGLIQRQPIRGAIDVAWGVELHAGELYGPVVARAYELESTLAKHPRIVVSPIALGVLKTHLRQEGDDPFSRLNRAHARTCLNMIARDVDGVMTLHYLGDEFRKTVTQTQHKPMYEDALKFIHQQLEQHRAADNSKLAIRYQNLLTYFGAHPPA